MGNHAVGAAFAATFETLGFETISAMSNEEILIALDTVGNKFRGADAEFDDYTESSYPFGYALMKVWGKDLPPEPNREASIEESDAWSDMWWDMVYQPFKDRYGFC